MFKMFDWIFHFKLCRKTIDEETVILSLKGSSTVKIPLEFLIYDILDDIIVRDHNFIELHFNIKISSALKTKEIIFSIVCDFLTYSDEAIEKFILEKLNSEIKLHSFDEFYYIDFLKVQITGYNKPR
jgi:hypothetical protein